MCDPMLKSHYHAMTDDQVIQSLFTQLDGAAAAAATQEEAGLSAVINQGNWKEVKLAYGLQ